MLAPATPVSEASRLRALHELKILDTESEERFDRLTRMARRMFGVPIALVSLVDANRQCFKSRQGLEAAQTGRDISFCGHAILGEDVFVIPDASSDQRFSDNPLVTNDPNIRFYAGCPLTLEGGHKVGTLCLIDREPRDFDGEDQAALRDLAEMAEAELAAVRLATIDELTQLSNRRGFESLAQRALRFCQRAGRAAALLYIDLNGFKPINDQFGHAEGDRALKDFAGLLMDVFRDTDVIGRLGGDEFAVLISGDAAGHRTATQRLNQAVEAHNAAHADRGYSLRFALGQVDFDPQRHADLAALMAEADARMYAIKQTMPAREARPA